MARRAAGSVTTSGSGPNRRRTRRPSRSNTPRPISKEMHVGHLPTTMVGGTIARILDFAGHHVRGPVPARV